MRAHTVLYLKNGSQIEIFSFLQLLTKMLNYSIYIKHFVRLLHFVCLLRDNQFVCPLGEKHFLHTGEGGANIFAMRGDKHFYTGGGQVFYLGGDGDYYDVEVVEERDVRCEGSGSKLSCEQNEQALCRS